MKTYDLDFEGYWLEANIGGLPAASGIYGVYAGTYNRSADTVALNRLIYIGESENMRERVKGHEKTPLWRLQLRPGEGLVFNAALIGPKGDRERAEAAMINHHKPVCNTEYVNEFPYDVTTITTRGRNEKMDSHFTVYRTSTAR